MTDDAVLGRARLVWAALAGAPVTFASSGLDVAVSASSSLCPPGWVGVVALGGAAVATAPDDGAAGLVRRALGGLPVSALTDPVAVSGRLPVGAVLGPATLAFCDAARFRGAGAGAGAGAVAAVGAADDGVRGLLARVPAADAGEAGLDEITSLAFVVRAGPDVVAAAGYRVWEGAVAHVSVLTAPAERGRGLARLAAGAAVAAALEAGLLPQWRARPEASRRVARALGFVELGSQLSIRLVR
ncbi:GNAT family N-acetyltransferase [Dactylosporangium sp. NPDC000521]|uniref:GNAT family N-acetyltransferase n=1 Tax=Dactylosporangium sp. NPDC000521 TaxID=3363975 RepID=UPI0036A1ADC4